MLDTIKTLLDHGSHVAFDGITFASYNSALAQFIFAHEEVGSYCLRYLDDADMNDVCWAADILCARWVGTALKRYGVQQTHFTKTRPETAG